MNNGILHNMTIEPELGDIWWHYMADAAEFVYTGTEWVEPHTDEGQVVVNEILREHRQRQAARELRKNHPELDAAYNEYKTLERLALGKDVK